MGPLLRANRPPGIAKGHQGHCWVPSEVAATWPELARLPHHTSTMRALRLVFTLASVDFIFCQYGFFGPFSVILGMAGMISAYVGTALLQVQHVCMCD